MTEAMIRSFIAVDIKEEIKRRILSKIQDILKSRDPSLKLVQPENIHITLHFLGEINSVMINQISKEIDHISFNPFLVGIRGIGVFPSLRRIRVVWAGIKKGALELETLFYQIEKRIVKLGFSSNQKKYSPHLTIARMKARRTNDRLIQSIKEFEDYDFGFTKVDSLELKRSVLTPRGPIYSTLHKVSAKLES